MGAEFVDKDYHLISRFVKYEPESGRLIWKEKPSAAVSAGDVAGCVFKGGYVRVKFKGKGILAHRIAWLLTYKKWPSVYLDHINGITSDNRLCNLREADSRKNQQNQYTHRSGRLPGSYLDKRRNKWCAQITIKGKRKNLGYFTSEADAHKRYLQEIESLGL